MREAEENIKFKMEIDVLVPIPRTVTRDFQFSRDRKSVV